MYTSTLFAVFSCLLVAAYSIPVSQPVKKSAEVEKCSLEHSISSSIGDQLAKHIKQAQNEDEKCFLSCYLKARDYFVNGKIDFKKLYEAHTRYVPKEQLEKVKETFDQCEKNMVYEGKTDCQIAYSAYQCAQ